MREPDGFGPHVVVACATTKPSGWIFGRLFFRTFFFRKKKVQKLKYPMSQLPKKNFLIEIFVKDVMRDKPSKGGEI